MSIREKLVLRSDRRGAVASVLGYDLRRWGVITLFASMFCLLWASQAHAVQIKTIYRGFANFDQDDTVASVDLPATVDRTKSIILISNSVSPEIPGSNTAVNDQSTFFTVQFEDAGAIQIQRGGATVPGSVSYQVVEFNDGVSVQAGVSSLQPSATSKTIDLNASIVTYNNGGTLNTTGTGIPNAIPIVYANGSAATTTATDMYYLAPTFPNASQLTFTRQRSLASFKALSITWQVIEFTKDAAVQTGSTTIAIAETQHDSADLSPAMNNTGANALFFTYLNPGTASAGQDARFAVKTAIVDNNTLRFSRTFQNNTANTECAVRWYAVDFREDGNTSNALGFGQTASVLTASGSYSPHQISYSSATSNANTVFSNNGGVQRIRTGTATSINANGQMLHLSGITGAGYTVFNGWWHGARVNASTFDLLGSTYVGTTPTAFGVTRAKLPISSSTDPANPNPIRLTLAADHNLATGDIIDVTDHSTNTNANGTFFINTGASCAGSSCSSTQLELVGSLGTSGTGASAGGATGAIKPSVNTTLGSSASVTTARTLANFSVEGGTDTTATRNDDLKFIGYLKSSTVFSTIRSNGASTNNLGEQVAANVNYNLFEFPSITMTYPNGGESLVCGTQYDFTWKSAAGVATNDWKLQYSTDGGSNYSDMGSYCGAGGTSPCTGTDLSTGTVKVKIPDILDTDIRFRIYDTTDAVSTVSRKSDATNTNITVKRSVTVTSPTDEAARNIQSSTNATPIVITTSAAHGYVTGEQVVISGHTTNTAANGTWTITVLSSTTFSLDTSVGNGVGGATGTVTRDLWVVGDTTRYIRWNFTGDVGLNAFGTLKLEYSKAGDFSDTVTIATGVARGSGGPFSGVGSYNWNPIPDMISTTAKIKITCESDTSVTSTSPAFTVLRYLALTQPVGGENLTAQTPWDIKWNYKGQTGWGTVKIEYSSDAPHAVWNTLATGQPVGGASGDTPPYSGKGAYTATNIPVGAVGTTTKVRVTSESSSSITSTSASNFTVVAKLSVTAPNGGETLIIDNSTDITWTLSAALSPATVKIEYSKAGDFSDTQTVIASTPSDSIDATHGNYPWTIPNNVQTNAVAKVRVTHTGVGSNPAITDDSDAGFRIKGKIDSISPNGGEIYSYGGNVPISWNLHGTYAADNVKIYLSSDGGATYPTLLQTRTATNGVDGWTWATGTQSPATNYRVKVALASDESNVFNNSAANFRIKPVLTVTLPNGSETWYVGDTDKNITFTKSPASTGDVDLYYSVDGGSNWVSIANGVSSSPYAWNPIPDGALTTSSTAMVKMQLSSDATVSDTSNATFNIKGKLVLGAPNGSESWEVGTTQNITWVSTPASQGNVRLKYSTDGGSTYPTTIATVASNSSPYAWTVADAIDTDIRVRVEGVTDGGVYDESNANFTIKPKFVVGAPNGGEVWLVGASNNITWSTAGSVDKVNLYYSTDSGSNWTQIASALSNINSYSWAVADAIGAADRVKVESYYDATAYDTSNADFTVRGSITMTSPDGGEVLTVGGSHLITWTKTGTLGNIKLQYSTDGGTNYTDIVNPTAASNLNYNWNPIADAISNTVRIRAVLLSDSNVTDASNANLAIKGSLTMTAPNGGETFYVGGHHNITWTKTGTLGNVKLIYSTDGGSTYPEPDNIIATGIAATDTPYDWTVPDIIQNDLRVKIVLLSDSTIQDASNGNFEVKGTLALTAPNGAENWEVGSSQNITWTKTGTLNLVKLEYSTNGGSTYPNTIATDLAAAGLSYTWTVPDAIGSSVRVKITSQDDPTVNDTSNANFAIKGKLVVTAPNGAESWYVADHHNITWTTAGTVPNVNLYYSTDGGTNWNLILGPTANSNLYDWTVPDAVGTSTRVKVENADDSAVADSSNANFFIRANLTITSPNGGQTWIVGESRSITWTRSGTMTTAKLEYSTNGGTTFPNTITASVETGDLNYAWTVPDAIGTQVRVKITLLSDNTVNDASDADFAIKGSVTLTAPNGGEGWTIGTHQNITWTKTGNIGNCALEYSADGGSNWSTIAASVLQTATPYDWTIPDDPSVQARVRITNIADPTVLDSSNANFSIKGSLALTSPNTNVTWGVGSVQNITWNVTGSLVNVKLEYSTDSGSTYPNLIIGSTSAPAGSYGWTIPDSVSDTVRVKVTDTINSTVSDTSDADFKIKPSLHLTAPDGGEAWVVGTAYDITWTKTGTIVNVKLEYSTDGGSTFPNTIISSTGAGALAYTWTIPDNITNQGVVRISKVGDSAVSDDSDAFFKIKGSLTVTAPNGTESWGINSHHDITWTKTGTVGNVSLKYSTDSGSTFPNTIVAGIDSALGTYDWTVSDNPTSTAIVKVVSDSDSTVFDISNGTFAITGSLFLGAPDGGEVWIVGASNNITWTKFGSIASVKLEYSTNGGTNYLNTIATGVSAGALGYAWTIPDAIGTTLRVKITDEGNANVNDASTSNFTIRGSVTVTSPNGNEIWGVGESHPITWTKTGSIGNVKIEYTTNGTDYTQIIDSVPSADLTYDWTVPDAISSTVKVRITALSDANVTDLSNGNFKIRGQLVLTAPNGGETWIVGASNAITWSRVGSVTTVKLEYGTDGGVTYPNSINNSVDGSLGTYSWTIPDAITSQARVRISDANDAGVVDTSNANFTIRGSITVTSPNGSEAWVVGSNHAITWTKTGTMTNVKIELSVDGGATFPSTIVASTDASAGTYAWNGLPDNLTSTARVKITNTGDANVLDTSDNNFKIQGSFTLVTPNGAEGWSVDTSQDITWTKVGSITTAKLEYTKDGGSNYVLIDPATPAADLSYAWTIPDDISTTVKVKISDANDSTVSDLSDANFEIRAGFDITSPDGGEVLTVGDSTDITWTKTGSAAAVKLEYSTNGGVSFPSVITASTSNSGTYAWTVPDAISTAARVRISDVDNANASNASGSNFKIRGAFTLTSPNGTESWDVASSHNVTWTKVGSVANAKLQLSKDGGSTYPITIIASTDATTLSYAWTIPDQLTTQGRVKISDASDPTVFDASDANFTIKGAVTLTAPNGGEVWVVNDVQNITWQRFGSVANVKLDYSTNSGATYPNSITSATDATTGSYAWNIPDAISSTLRVKVTDADNALVFDASNADFSIKGAVVLNAPNGGETWVVGASQNITWTRTGSIANMKLEYSTDSGSTYPNLIISQTDASTGTYAWTIPDAIGSTLRVKVTDASNSTVTDTSNADFTVKGSLTLTAPNGGEIWKVAESRNITWTKTGTIANVKLEYSTNGGNTYPNTITNSTDATTQTYSWTVPNVIGTQLRVRITHTGDASVVDTSNANFEVKGVLLLVVPNGGESWAVNTVQTITWSRTGSIANVKLDYSKDGGSTYNNAIVASTDASTGTYDWTIPDDINSTVRVKVEDASDSAVSDTSNANFKIVGSLTLTAPNGAEQWTVGTQHNVTWTRTGTIANVKLEYTTDGSNFTTIVGSYSAAGLSYTWTVPDAISATVKVRISDAADATVLDLSNANFTILGGFAVTAPNGGEVWTVGSAQDITWTTAGTVANVKLDYSTNGGTTYPNVISAGTSNTETYSWTIPDAIGTTLKVRVSDATNANAKDESNATFKIRGSFTLTSPNGSEAWVYNTHHDITWTKVGSIALAKLEYSTNGGSTYPNLIATNVDAATGSPYDWTVPDALSTTVRVKITDASDGTVFDASDANFAIKGTLTMTAPNGAEDWVVGTVQNITWTKTGSIQNVKLDYSTNGGSTYPNAITPSTDATQAYAWTIPDAIGSSLRVKATDVDNSTVSDASDANFSVKGALTVGSPNGGEILFVGNSQNITWSRTGSVANVKIEYSTNSGSTYPNVIVNTTDASTGTYAWTVADAIGTALRVKVTDTTNSTVSDTSNGDFTVKGQLTLGAPDGGEVWIIATAQDIVWSRNGSIANVKLEYSTNAGSTYPNVITASTDASTGTYTWTIPDAATIQGRVRVSDVSDSSVKDESSANFTIKGSLTLTAPNGSEAWGVGTSQNITWTKSGTMANVRLSYSTDGGATYPTEIIDSTNASTGTYAWTIPDDLSITCRVKVEQVGNATVFDASNANFKIIGALALTAPNGNEQWKVGTAYNITWTRTGNITAAKLELSLNGGSTFPIQITASTPAGGLSYNWTVPDNITTSARIRISDASDATVNDTSDANFKIQAVFALTSPNGAEIWTVAESRDITWSTVAGTVSNVKLEYSSDSGTNYSTITASVGNTGTYAWTVPDSISATTLVRVSDVNDASALDVSNAIFKIRGALTITSPNGAESWDVASSHNITWTRTGSIPTAKLEYSTNGGSTYPNLIIASTNASTGSYAWTIPDALTTTARVKITDTSDSTVNDTTDNNFIIKGALAITAPNGGELWIVDSAQDITWTRFGSITDVKLEYSINGGSTYPNVIIASTDASLLTYTWTIPDTLTTTARVKITDVNNAAVTDASDANFAIGGAFTLVSPNGGQVWVVGESRNITWSRAGSILNAKLEYSTNGGSTYPNLIVGVTDASTLSYAWTVPDAIGSSLRVKISDSSNATVYDTSDANFTVKGSLTLTAPNGAETWIVGDANNITWSRSGTIASVNLEYSTNGGSTFPNVIINGTNGLTGSYSWTVADAISTSVRVRVTDASDASVFDASDANFTVKGSLTLTAPNGGEAWVVGSSQNVTWSKTGTMANVKIDYSTDSGSTYPNSITSSTSATAGTYAWTIPDDIQSAVRVKVTNTSDNTVFDASNTNFKIVGAFTLTAPNGGELWKVNTNQNVTWTRTGSVGFVKLEYSTNAGSTYPNTIVSSTPAGALSYTWTIPDNLTTQARVRVSDASDITVNDTSDANFSIAASFTITAPDGGEVWTVNSSQDITWNKVGSAVNVKLEYSTDGGTTYPNTIAGSTGNSGTFAWTVPDAISATVKVKISDVNNANAFDVSNSNFKIRGSLTLTAPNGGESWNVASSQNITWTRVGSVATVKLEYSTDSGSTYPNLINGTVDGSLLTYAWTMPDDISANVKVKATDASDSTVYDESNATFRIRGTFTLTSPNGTEVWDVASAHNITWTKVGSIASAKLELSTDAGGTYPVTIVSSIQASDLSYSWTVPDNISTQCRVRISDVSDSVVKDVSDANFKIRGTFTLTAPNGADVWNVTASKNITWTKTGTISTAKLEYSTNSGSTYPNVINNNVDATALTYAWTIPDSISDTVRVKITNLADTTVNDTSDADFSIRGVLTLSAPNGGEVWSVGSSQGITWTKAGTISTVKLDYSTDGGVNYNKAITASTPASDLSYAWTVPDDLSATVRVKITNNSDSNVNDTSDGNFKIRGSFTITSPNGTEGWVIGSTHNITWTKTGTIANARLDYSKDSGATYPYSITTSTPATNLTYSWIIPDDTGTQIRVKVSDAGDSTVFDASDANFTIRGGFTVTSPVGSERWAVGSTHDITWVTGGTIPNVKLEYSTNAGASYTTIIGSTTNNNTYSWLIPDALTVQGRIKVSDATDPQAADASPANFTIHGTLTLTAPNGAEQWLVGSSQNVTWTKTGSIGNVKLEYSTNSGSTYPNLISGSVSAAALSYSWTIPDAIGNNLKVRITDLNDALVLDVSDNIFKIKSQFSITAPNGSENWLVATSQNIIWGTQGTVANVKLEYSTDAGSTFTSIINSTANAGTYAWTVPDAITTQGRVRVSDASDSSALDVSDNNFKIRGGLTITAPNGAEKWGVGTSSLITWTRIGSIPTVKLEYSTNNGGVYVPITASTGNTGAYSWTVPDAISTQALIRITDTSDATVTDVSDAAFKIMGNFTVTAPNGGEVWTVASSQNITWTSSGSMTFAKIEYSTDGGSNYNLINGSTSNNGLYAWTVPDAVTGTAKIKVSDPNDVDAYDESNANFRIRLILVLTAPNGGQKWTVGRTNNITWSKVGTIPNVKLQYSTDGFLADINTITGSTSNTGTYSWTLPDAISNTVRVRVSDPNDIGAYDDSNADFKIMGGFVVVSPNGGEKWDVNSSQTITWTHTGSVSEAKITYSTNGGATYPNIIAQTTNNDSYAWTVPDDISASFKIKIEDPGDSDAFDVTDANAKIRAKFTVTSPNGGEVWTVAEAHNITWTTVGTVSNVKLDYSTDGGSTYPNSITSSVSNTGTYSWTIPDAISTTVRARVMSATDTDAFDGSDANLKIRGAFAVTAPNGAEQWKIAQSNNITWSTTGTIADVKIYYSTNSGATFPNVIINSVANTNTYAWTVPDVPTTTARIRVENVLDSTVYDDSNADFKIQGFFTLTAPNGGEAWIVGTSHNIAWTWGGTIANVKLTYSTDSGSTFPNVIQASTSNGAGSSGSYSYSWTVPDSISSTVRVRVEDPNDATVYDDSNADFKIRGAFTLTAPNGGERWVTYESRDITWTTSGTVPNVKLVYSHDNFATSTTIINSTANNNSYSWTIPDPGVANIPKSTKVRVLDVNDATVYDDSDAVFNIDYYYITWEIRDLLTNGPLSDLTVLEVKATDPDFLQWSEAGVSCNPPRVQPTPAGTWVATWKKTAYSDLAYTVVADQDRTVQIFMETSAIHLWLADSTVTYNPTTTAADVLTWLSRDGSVVTGTIQCDFKIYNGTTLVWSNTVMGGPDSTGFYHMTVPAGLLQAGISYSTICKAYNATGGAITTPSSFEVTTPKTLKDVQNTVNARLDIPLSQVNTQLQQTLNDQTQTITTKLDEQTTTINTKLDAQTQLIQQTLTSFEQTIENSIDRLQDAADTAVESAQTLEDTALKFSWKAVCAPNPALSGDKVLIQAQGPTGLFPRLSVYNHKNKQVIVNGLMTEDSSRPGNYSFEFNVTGTNFEAGQAYTYIVTDDVTGGLVAGSGFVESISLTSVAGLASSAPAAEKAAKEVLEAFKEFEGSAAKGGNLDRKLKNLENAVAELPSKIEQVTKASGGDTKQIRNTVNEIVAQLETLGAGQGLNMQEMFTDAIKKSDDIQDIKATAETVRVGTNYVSEVMKKEFGGIKPEVTTSFDA